MPVNVRKIIYILVLFVFTAPTTFWGQTESSTAFDSLKITRQRLTDLQEEQLLYLHQMDSLSAEIDRIKQDDYQSYFKRRRLENMLRRFHEINTELIRVENELQTVKSAENRWLQLILKNNDDRGPKAIPSVKSKGSGTAAETSDSLDERYQDLIARLRPGSQDRSEIGGRIRLEPNDTPRQIERKADILKDREDKLRAQAKLIREKIDQARGTTELRQRLGELLDDVSLFDHRDEPISPQRQSTRDSKIAVTDMGSPGAGSKTMKRPGLLPLEDLMKVDFKEMSDSEAEEIARKLEDLLQQVEKMAESLAIEAEKFYHAAKNRRNEKK